MTARSGAIPRIVYLTFGQGDFSPPQHAKGATKLLLGIFAQLNSTRQPFVFPEFLKAPHASCEVLKMRFEPGDLLP